jgi:hypothetical protein
MSLGTTNLSTSLISSTLGVSSHDVGTLCKSTSINMWAIYKPVVSNVIDATMTDCTIFDGTNANFMMMKNVNFGLNPNITSLAAVTTSYQTAQTFTGQTYPTLTPWTYTPPTGGASSPYRMGDFRAYNPAATPFLLYNSDFSFIKETGILATSWQPAIRYGFDSGSQVVSGTLSVAGSEIPLNQLVIGGNNLMDGSWSFGLLFVNNQSGNNYNYVVIGNYVNNSGTNYISPIISGMTGTNCQVNFNGTGTNASTFSRTSIVNQLNNLTVSSTGTETGSNYIMDAVPVLVQNLKYVPATDIYTVDGTSKIISYPTINSLYNGRVRIRCFSKMQNITINLFESHIITTKDSTNVMTINNGGLSNAPQTGSYTTSLVVHKPLTLGVQIQHLISIVNNGSTPITINSAGLQIMAGDVTTTTGVVVNNYTWSSHTIGSIAAAQITIPALNSAAPVYLYMTYAENPGSEGAFAASIDNRPNWANSQQTSTVWNENTLYSENGVNTTFSGIGTLIGCL